ncbi:MAG: hypothetical protein II295_04165 [Akkermansia sp.]|nr:hypothetical protein [Akkermansia sp.]
MELPFFELPAGKFTLIIDEDKKLRVKCLEGDKRFVSKLEALLDAPAETEEESRAIMKKIMNLGGVDDYLEHRIDDEENASSIETEESEPVPIN